jgi:hypothetical protein
MRRRTIRSGFRGEKVPKERVQGSFHSPCYPLLSSYKPMPLPQIHAPLSSDTLEFAACLVAHFYTFPVLWWGVIRYARLVLYVCWPSSRCAQLRLECKQRRPSTSNHIAEHRDLILPKTLSLHRTAQRHHQHRHPPNIL